MVVLSFSVCLTRFFLRLLTANSSLPAYRKTLADGFAHVPRSLFDIHSNWGYSAAASPFTNADADDGVMVVVSGSFPSGVAFPSFPSG